MRAPRLSATLRATSRSPRRTSTSVTASPSTAAPKSPADAPGFWFWRDRQIGLLQARRQFEHRAGDGDIVVVGQRPQHSDRRVARPAPDDRRVRRAPCSRFPRSAARIHRRTGRHARRCSWLAPARNRAVMRCNVSARLWREPCCNDLFQFRDQRERGTHLEQRQSRCRADSSDLIILRLLISVLDYLIY